MAVQWQSLSKRKKKGVKAIDKIRFNKNCIIQKYQLGDKIKKSNFFNTEYS